MNKQEIADLIIENVKSQMAEYGLSDWTFEIDFRSDSSVVTTGRYINNGVTYEGVPSFSKASLLALYKAEKQHVGSRFNKLTFHLSTNDKYLVEYQWDSQLIQDNEAASAEVFPQWLNERMLALLFEAGYGEDARYWQRGEFTFTIVGEKVIFNGKLYDNDREKKIDIVLSSLIIEEIKKHYRLTNEGSLKNKWSPWNRLIICSPHNTLNLEKDVTYELINY